MKNINKAYVEYVKILQNRLSFIEGYNLYIRNGISNISDKDEYFIKGYALSQKRFSLKH